jgi:molecular chaperone GrpE
MPEREADRVETSIPGVSVTDADDQVRMDETSEREQTPAAQLEDSDQISLDELKALKADLENTRKRMIKEQSRWVEHASKDLVKNLLPVLDHFHLAIDHGEAGGGVQLAFKELMEVLRAAGLAEIEVEAGVRFDPEVHHALTTVMDPEVEAEVVMQVHRRGYRFKDHVLRAPEVVVAQPKGPDREEG